MQMETLVTLSWRGYLAVPLMALGATCAVWGVKRGLTGLRCAMRGDSAQLVAFMVGFRATVWGLAGSGSSPGCSWSHSLSVAERRWKHASFSLRCGMGHTWRSADGACR
jgi:hypothetical protein